MRGRLIFATVTASLTFLSGPPSAVATTCANREAPAHSADSTLVEVAVLCETNNQRAYAGLPPLRRNEQITAAARAHARDMVDRGYFDHRSPEGYGPTDRAAMNGYTVSGCCGENIYTGPNHAQEVVEGWMNSPGHRANILDTSYQEIGVGVVGTMYVQVFSGGLLAPGITGLESEYQGNPGRDPSVQVSVDKTIRGRERPNAWHLRAHTPSPGPLRFTATDIRSGATRQFGHAGDGSAPLALPAGVWRLCWELPPVSPYGSASSCLSGSVQVEKAPGVKLTALGNRNVRLLAGRAAGRRARVVVQQRERHCKLYPNSDGYKTRYCSSRWVTMRRFALTLRERLRLRLSHGLHREARARVVLTITAFEAEGVPYWGVRLTRRLR